MNMNQDDLRAIAARLEAITPGTWEVERWQLWEEWGQPSPDPDHVWLIDGPSWSMNGPEDALDSEADAEFIAHAPADIRALLDQHDADLDAARLREIDCALLETRVAELERALREIVDLGSPLDTGSEADMCAIARAALED